MRRRRLLLRLALLAGFIVVALAARALLLKPDAVVVKVVAVGRGRVEETVTNSRAGTVKARRRAKLSPEIGGRVAALPHPRGDRVVAGDLLLRIDDALQRAQLAVAERELAAASAQREQACLAAERADRELARTRRLAQDGIVSPDLLDQVQSGERGAHAACSAAAAVVEKARSAVELARTELAKTLLRSPLNGVVADVSIQVGEWTTPSPPGLPIPAVIDVFDPASIYASAPMDEVDSARIRAGQDARVTLDSHPGRSFPGRVVAVSPYVLDVQAQNRTVEIEVELEDRELARLLLPGTSADAEVILSVREDVLRIPTTALMEGSRTLLVEDGRLAERRVEVGVRNWDFTEVRRGLATGERLVVSFDRPEIKPGARVQLEKAASP